MARLFPADRSPINPLCTQNDMLPGPTIFRKCSSCTGTIAQETICPGNTCEATLPTDDEMDATMWADSPSLVVCPHCRVLVWINELEKIGAEMFADPKGGFKDARAYEMPDFADYIAFLEREGLMPKT